MTLGRLGNKEFWELSKLVWIKDQHTLLRVNEAFDPKCQVCLNRQVFGQYLETKHCVNELVAMQPQ